jgi:hypothetical protein
MEHHHSEYRGWKLCTIPDRPCLGHGVRAAPPHDVIMAKGPTEKSVRTSCIARLTPSRMPMARRRKSLRSDAEGLA